MILWENNNENAEYNGKTCLKLLQVTINQVPTNKYNFFGENQVVYENYRTFIQYTSITLSPTSINFDFSAIPCSFIALIKIP